MSSKLFRTLPRRSLFSPTTTLTTRLHPQTRLAHQDYGSGAGDPVGENPQAQGKNPSEDKEHPGPPPPSVAKGSNNKNNSNNDSSDKSKTQSSGSEKKGESNVSPSGGDAQQAANGARPTILREGQGMGEGVDQKEVDRHNEEMARRADKPAEKVKDKDIHRDKVEKPFWAGQGGADRDP